MNKGPSWDLAILSSPICLEYAVHTSYGLNCKIMWLDLDKIPLTARGEAFAGLNIALWMDVTV